MSFYVRYSLVYFMLVNYYTQGQFLGAYQRRKPIQPIIGNVYTNNIYRLNHNMDPISTNNNNNVNSANLLNELREKINVLKNLNNQYNLNNRLNNMNNMNLNNNNVNPNNYMDERNNMYQNENNNEQNAPNDYSEATAARGGNLFNDSNEAYQPPQQNYNLNSNNNKYNNNMLQNGTQSNFGDNKEFASTQSNIGDNKEFAKVVAKKVIDYLTSDESRDDDKNTSDLNGDNISPETNASGSSPDNLDDSSITSETFDDNKSLEKEKEKHEEKHEHDASHKHKHLLKSLKVSKFLFQVKPVVPETSRQSDKETLYYIE